MTAVDVHGLEWKANGTAVLSGPLLGYAQRLDHRFLELAARWDAAEVRYPPLIARADLDRIDYFTSFPHLATLATGLDADLGFRELAPAHDVLTPAACYPVYISVAGQHVGTPRYVTLSSTCFRREAEFVPLERQWAFTMREVVCVGTADDVRGFVSAATAAADELRAEAGLTTRWDDATDPFFQPSRNPKALMQLIDPVKRELLFDDRLAIASTNLHHDSFGRAYGIRDRDDAPVHTACLAFGLERWLAALAQTYGPDPADWPALEPVS